MSPSVFWEATRKGENTNKHYFQTPKRILGNSHYSVEGHTYKAICISTSGGSTSGELQFCRSAVVLPTSFDCSYCNNQTSFALPSRNIKRMKKQKQSRKWGQENASGMIFLLFFWMVLYHSVIAPFLAETCIAHTVQLRTLAQSSHNGGLAVTDQGDLYQPLHLPPWLQICWWLSIPVQ